jgi:hypothetical protein
LPIGHRSMIGSYAEAERISYSTAWRRTVDGG